MISFQLEATPICGLTQSSSPIPTARNIPREAVASSPSVTVRLRGLISGVFDIPLTVRANPEQDSRPPPQYYPICLATAIAKPATPPAYAQRTPVYDSAGFAAWRKAHIP
ncbi:hypothetical protein GCM10009554_01670 [Kribbella koreensis]|uniref:Uncharacterized protein n=1 Tax=Kribbella koreensis TaxID=57909 RepID=A0ABN1P672_9ACTN